jgi:hypothetical protein
MTCTESTGALVSTTPTLTWYSSTFPTGTALGHYELQIATNSTFTANLQDIDNGTATSFSVSTPLPAGKYYWRVRTYNADGEYSAWSAYRYFITH